MDEHLDSVLGSIARDYASRILHDSRFYTEVDIGERAKTLGLPSVGERYRSVKAVIPIREPLGAMRVRIDGRTFVDYAQFDSGVVVPGYVAKESRLPRRVYTPWDSMVLGFAQDQAEQTMDKRDVTAQAEGGAG